MCAPVAFNSIQLQLCQPYKTPTAPSILYNRSEMHTKQIFVWEKCRVLYAVLWKAVTVIIRGLKAFNIRQQTNMQGVGRRAVETRNAGERLGSGGHADSVSTVATLALFARGKAMQPFNVARHQVLRLGAGVVRGSSLPCFGYFLPYRMVKLMGCLRTPQIMAACFGGEC